MRDQLKCPDCLVPWLAVACCMHVGQELGQHHLYRARAMLSLERARGPPLLPRASASRFASRGFLRHSGTLNGIFALGQLPRKGFERSFCCDLKSALEGN